MSKKINITFKKHAPYTGLMAVGHPYQVVDIKFNKQTFGHISPPNWRDKDNKWTVRVARYYTEGEENPNPNCPWRWVSFRASFDNEANARVWCKENLPEWLQQFTPYYSD